MQFLVKIMGITLSLRIKVYIHDLMNSVKGYLRLELYNPEHCIPVSR